ncbi:MAG TPA: radical SAM protein [Cyclobacteriaceae bacterium]
MIQRISNKIRKLNAIYYPQHVFQAPKWLVLGVNNTCNLHCKMCDVGVNYTQSNFFENLMGTRPVHMPRDLFRHICDQASRYYPHARLGYAFTEPLIYVHLAESLEYAKSKKLFTSLTTNGLGLKRWAEVLDEAGLGELNVSLDGPPEIHNHIRGNKHSFDLAMEGIEALTARNTRIRISIYCVITEWNAGHLTSFLQCLEGKKLHRVGLMHSNFTPQHIADHHNEIFGGLYPATASNVTDTTNEAMPLDLLWQDMQDVKRRTWPFQVQFFPELGSLNMLEQYYTHPEIFVGRRCLDVFSNIMIKSNGDVIPAHGRCYNLKVGNLYEHSLQEIWNSAVFAQFRKSLTDHGGLLPACSRCCSAFIR